MARDFLIERLPEVLVDHRLFRRRHPALSLPAVNPGGDAVLEVFGIGHDFHFATLFERAQALDRGHQLHAVVRRVRLAAPKLLFVAVVPQNAGPASRAWVAETGP